MKSTLLSIIFLISLVSQSPLITGLKSEKSITSESKSILDGTKLIMSLETGDVVVRRPRGTDIPHADMPKATDEISTPKTAEVPNEKRSKNGGHGNKKLSRNQDINAPVGGRNKHHIDKKPLNSGEQQQQQHHQHTGKRQQLANRQQQHGSLKSNKQRQLLKSQQHQGHQGHQGGKRNNQHNKQTVENGEHGNDGGKAQSTCRYTKSAWSDCDQSTNTHSRTLTLKRGDSNCLPTRTIQKKCKKACRYEKGTWSECKDGQMARVDMLKISAGTSTVSTIDSSCEATRSVSRKCNPVGNAGKSSKSHQNGNGKANKKERKNKDKANNRSTQQA